MARLTSYDYGNEEIIVNEEERLLSSKGFLNSVVTINDETVDVVVANQDLSSVARAQIEDAVSRTCSCNLDQIVITKMKLSD